MTMSTIRLILLLAGWSFSFVACSDSVPEAGQDDCRLPSVSCPDGLLCQPGLEGPFTCQPPADVPMDEVVDEMPPMAPVVQPCDVSRAMMMNGLVDATVVLAAQCSPYALSERGLTVSEGASLIVEPGVSVHPRSMGGAITVRGRLFAVGRSDAPIVFGPDGDAAPGQWAGLIFEGTQNTLAHVQIHGADTALTVVNGAGLSLLEDLHVRQSHRGLLWTSDHPLRGRNLIFEDLTYVGIGYQSPPQAIAPMDVYLEDVTVDDLKSNNTSEEPVYGLILVGSGARGDGNTAAGGRVFAQGLTLENIEGSGLAISDPDVRVSLTDFEVANIRAQDDLVSTALKLGTAGQFAGSLSLLGAQFTNVEGRAIEASAGVFHLEDTFLTLVSPPEVGAALELRGNESSQESKIHTLEMTNIQGRALQLEDGIFMVDAMALDEIRPPEADPVAIRVGGNGRPVDGFTLTDFTIEDLAGQVLSLDALDVVLRNVRVNRLVTPSEHPVAIRVGGNGRPATMVSIETAYFRELTGNALSIVSGMSTMVDIQIDELVTAGDDSEAIRVGGNGRPGTEATLNGLVVESLRGRALTMNADFNFISESQFDDVDVPMGLAAIGLGANVEPQASVLRDVAFTQIVGQAASLFGDRLTIDGLTLVDVVTHGGHPSAITVGGNAQSVRTLEGRNMNLSAVNGHGLVLNANDVNLTSVTLTDVTPPSDDPVAIRVGGNGRVVDGSDEPAGGELQAAQTIRLSDLNLIRVGGNAVVLDGQVVALDDANLEDVIPPTNDPFAIRVGGNERFNQDVNDGRPRTLSARLNGIHVTSTDESTTHSRSLKIVDADVIEIRDAQLSGGLTIESPGASVVFADLEVSGSQGHGVEITASGAHVDGGAQTGALTRVRMDDLLVEKAYRGIDLSGSTLDVTVDNSVIRRNRHRGISALGGWLRVEDSVIHENFAEGVYTESTVALVRCRLFGNLNEGLEARPSMDDTVAVFGSLFDHNGVSTDDGQSGILINADENVDVELSDNHINCSFGSGLTIEGGANPRLAGNRVWSDADGCSNGLQVAYDVNATDFELAPSNTRVSPSYESLSDVARVVGPLCLNCAADQAVIDLIGLGMEMTADRQARVLAGSTADAAGPLPRHCLDTADGEDCYYWNLSDLVVGIQPGDTRSGVELRAADAMVNPQIVPGSMDVRFSDLNFTEGVYIDFVEPDSQFLEPTRLSSTDDLTDGLALSVPAQQTQMRYHVPLPNGDGADDWLIRADQIRVNYNTATRVLNALRPFADYLEVLPETDELNLTHADPSSGGALGIGGLNLGGIGGDLAPEIVGGQDGSEPGGAYGGSTEHVAGMFHDDILGGLDEFVPLGGMGAQGHSILAGVNDASELGGVQGGALGTAGEAFGGGGQDMGGSAGGTPDFGGALGGTGERSEWFITKVMDESGAREERFGHALDIDGNVAVIGAYRATVNGNITQGKAVVWERGSDGQWRQGQTLLASDGGPGALFGYSVAVSGGVIMIGAYRADVGATALQGSVYVFARNQDGIWVEAQILTASDGGVGDFFGYDVAVDGDIAITLAYEARDSDLYRGAIYIFERQLDQRWQQTQTLVLSSAQNLFRMGHDVALNGDHIVVGGHPVDDAIQSAGSVHVFYRYSDGVWRQSQTLTASDGDIGDKFGAHGLALGRHRLVVGSHREQRDDQSTGAAYVFEFDDDRVWREKAKLMPQDGLDAPGFGMAVAVSGSIIAVGAPDYATEDAEQGLAQVFVEGEAGWQEVHTVHADNGVRPSSLGRRIHIDGRFLLVGDMGDDTLDTDAGAAYFLSLDALFPTCGDGVIDGLVDGPRSRVEVCDDGNTDPGDGCSPQCRLEKGWVCEDVSCSNLISTCGDGIRVGIEVCDDYRRESVRCDYGLESCLVCSDRCTIEVGLTQYCGNDQVDEGSSEECDDGNTLSGDGCSDQCVLEND